MRVLSIIPVRTDSQKNSQVVRPLNGRSALQRTIDFVSSITKLPHVVHAQVCVATNDPLIREACKDFSDTFISERTEESLHGALQEALTQCEQRFATQFDFIVVVEPLYPFRPAALIPEALELLRTNEQADSVVAASPLTGHLWLQDTTMQGFVESSLQPMDASQAKTLFIENLGLLSAARRDVVRAGSRVGDAVGLVVIDEMWRYPELANERAFEIALALEPVLGR